MDKKEIVIIGGGLAGCEAAWQVARRGIAVRLFEMRPEQHTPAHQTDLLAELVCSNSLKSMSPDSATFLLQQEMRSLHSLLIHAADECRVPAGQALAVDRRRFSQQITDTLSRSPLIEVVRQECEEIPSSGVAIIASGPLTSDRLSQALAQWAGSEHLSFYDAISPIVEADSLDYGIIFAASRYDKGGQDYLNCPMDAAEFQRFFEALCSAETVATRDFETPKYFEACLPLEELARRGKETLLFGPLKPVGLLDPRTGKRPHAVIQLRKENLLSDSYNLVGCQNHMRFAQQKKVFQLVPGMEKAEFLRYGQIHRNTFIDGPRLLQATLQSRKDPRILFAGQLCGVEGYLESIATGLVAGIQAACLVLGETPRPFPADTACGSLCRYVAESETRHFQPMNITFGLLPPSQESGKIRKRDKKERRVRQIQGALDQLGEFQKEYPPLQMDR